MPRFGRHSLQVRATLDPRLQRLFDEVIKDFDCTLLEGFRNAKRQHELFLTGKSMKDWPESKHNKKPSKGIDAVPYPVDWNDRDRMYYFAGWVMGTAKKMGIPLRWGGDFDEDMEVRDSIFNDLGHFELRR